jgi:putative membrane protein insertion efficiency factor
MRSLLAAPLVFLVRVYQRLISPLLPPSCRYYPSCSEYAVTALQRFGPLKGTWLAARRLGRCHPWSPGGVDHVPARPGEVLDELGRSRPANPDHPRTLHTH